jgi:hypothetical protein
MENNRPANIDSPTTDDRLVFTVYAAGIARTIREAAMRNQLPLTIGIYGRWGSGKTSLMKMVETELARSSQPLPQTQAKRDSAQSLVPFLWRFQIVYGLLLLTAWIYAQPVGNWLSARMNTEPEVLTVGWLFASFVALGGLTRAYFAVWWHGRVENDLDALGIIRIALTAPVSFLVGALLFLALNYTPKVTAVITGWSGLTTIFYVAGCILGLCPQEVIRLPLTAWRVVRGGNSRAPLASDPTAVPQFQIIWFNAWKYADEKELWAALLQRLLSELKINSVGGKRVRIKWQLWKRSIEWKSGSLDIARKLIPTVGKALAALVAGVAGSWLARLAVPTTASPQVAHAATTATGVLSILAVAGAWLHTNVATPLADVDFEKYRKKASYTDHVAFLTEFSEELKEITDIARGAGNPIVLMLDDLDRCLPEEAVSVLEAIKLFVGDETQVVFVVGADREFIERAIDVMYASLKDKDDTSAARKERFSQLGHEYLEKVVQLPFNLPPLEVDRIDQFIDELFSEDSLVKDHSQIFAAGLLANPRQVLRAVGTFRFVAGLADEKGDLYAKRVVPAILAKLVVLQYRWPELYAELLDMPSLLTVLEQHYTGVPLPANVTLTLEQEAAIERHKSKSGVRAMLTLPPTLVGVDLTPYLFLVLASRAQEPSAPVVTATPGAQTSASVPATSEPIVKAAAAPAGSTIITPGIVEAPPSQASTPSATASAAPPPAPPPTISSQDVNRFSSLLDTLGKGGADAAIVSRLFNNKTRIDSYVASNSIDLAQKLLSDSLDSAEKEIQRLEKASPESSLIEAEVSRDGVLQFQRAITYNPLEVQITEMQEAGSQLRYAFFERNRQTANGVVQNSVLTEWQKTAAAYESGLASSTDLISLGGGLSQVIPLLSSLNFRLSRRLHLISSAPVMDALPWELLLLGGERQHIGINPRHSVVRGCPDQPLPSGVIKFPIPIVIAGFDGNLFSANDVQGKLNVLNGAFQPLVDTDTVRTVLLDRPSPDQLFKTLSKEAPQIVHLVSADHFNLDSMAQVHLPPSSNGVITQTPVKDFGLMLKEAGVRVLVLEVPNSRPTARALANWVPAVVGMQGLYHRLGDAIFPIAFHRALLRTGQADFAITEARRALYSAPPPQATGFSLGFPSMDLPGDPNRALAPVLYQAAGSGLIFEPAATTTSKPQSKSA